MDEDKIVLDRKSFNALAVDTRVKILKSLKERRKTLSEISQEQGMSVSGIKEHLETLESVDLIQKIDDGHKWKYYELTKKGREIVAPRELRVWILLSIAAIALIASMTAILSVPQSGAVAPVAASPPAENVSSAPAAPMMEAATMSNATSVEPAPEENTPAQPDIRVPIAVGVISALSILACVAILIRNRMRATSI